MHEACTDLVSGLICGAGIARLTLAWCLGPRGHVPLVTERLGLLPDLEAIHYPVDRLVLVDRRGSDRFSVPYAALRRRLVADRVAFRFGTTVSTRAITPRTR